MGVKNLFFLSAKIYNVKNLFFREAISKETDLEVLCELLYGMGQCVEELGSDLVTQQDLEVVFTILHEQLNAYEERRADREKVLSSLTRFLCTRIDFLIKFWVQETIFDQNLGPRIDF